MNSIHPIVRLVTLLSILTLLLWFNFNSMSLMAGSFPESYSLVYNFSQFIFIRFNAFLLSLPFISILVVRSYIFSSANKRHYLKILTYPQQKYHMDISLKSKGSKPLFHYSVVNRLSREIAYCPFWQESNFGHCVIYCCKVFKRKLASGTNKRSF